MTLTFSKPIKNDQAQAILPELMQYYFIINAFVEKKEDKYRKFCCLSSPHVIEGQQ